MRDCARYKFLYYPVLLLLLLLMIPKLYLHKDFNFHVAMTMWQLMHVFLIIFAFAPKPGVFHMSCDGSDGCCIYCSQRLLILCSWFTLFYDKSPGSFPRSHSREDLTSSSTELEILTINFF